MQESCNHKSICIIRRINVALKARHQALEWFISKSLKIESLDVQEETEAVKISAVQESMQLLPNHLNHHSANFLPVDLKTKLAGARCLRRRLVTGKLTCANGVRTYTDELTAS